LHGLLVTRPAPSELVRSVCLVQALADVDIPTSYELRDGNPVLVLLAIARERDADLLVLGSRGLGGFPDQLLGSTSTQVAQQAPCPVVIVPAARAD